MAAIVVRLWHLLHRPTFQATILISAMPMS
jgi:hypothetical protein